jgi:acyl-CoA reductase-like NAD-dependent aldehyde dehydrogenase
LPLWQDPATPFPKDYVPCYDPGSLHLLGSGRAHADTPAEVLAKVDAAHAAQLVWARSSFAQRRKLLRIMQRFILDNQHTICAVSARDSGKPMVDASFGEVMVTLEKINWLCDEGEQWLRPERRSAGTMMFYKHASVQYVPVGVMGAIVPWNYPFHNVFNPLLSNLFAGNALVVKVSEFATWSSEYYGRVIKAALAAAGAPTDLVQIVTGYGEAGHALVTAPKVGKLVFVGSTAVGRKVMAAASAHLKPVVLELGGKDAFIVCDDADLAQVVPIALRGAFQSCGQNCAGAERFFVQRPLYDAFVRQVGAVTEKMRAGWALNPSGVDAGAMCMPQQAAFVKGLVDDAVKQGAVVIAQARIVGDGCGQFCAPCVLAGVTQSMRISQEEVFGPVLCVSAFDSDDEAVRLANGCAFGLGSSVFSRSGVRARRIAGQLQAGMSSINDFATTYMAQSLPFGGVKESGFDRFAGVEGLRGCCIPKAFAQDRWPWLIRTDIPPPLQYPVKAYAFDFVASLIKVSTRSVLPCCACCACCAVCDVHSNGPTAVLRHDVVGPSQGRSRRHRVLPAAGAQTQGGLRARHAYGQWASWGCTVRGWCSLPAKAQRRGRKKLETSKSSYAACPRPPVRR